MPITRSRIISAMKRGRLFWHNPADNHYCMNAELFDEIIKNASFEAELFYDMKPGYYAFAGERKKLDRSFKEIKGGKEE